jgi:adenylate kinase family enzyme
MKKIMIIGISGTGKSMLARKLADKMGLPLYHMDAIIWQEHWVETATADITRALDEIAAKDTWMIEGWADHYSKKLLAAADMILYLDYKGWRAAYAVLKRWWRYRGEKRPELPEGCVEVFSVRFLYNVFMRKERAQIERILAENPKFKVRRILSRRELALVINQEMKQA